MARISYSQLSMFNECPQRWKLNYVDKLSVSEPISPVNDKFDDDTDVFPS